ncbi:MAG TPA: alpha/beta hydrolase, partial [Parachlamydiaceae bacterium]|nr:alpha/beta hydrolase [Parachlamydiaceae bacterium]
AALITNPGQFDIMDSLKKAYPGIVELIHDDPNNEIGKNIGQALSNPMFASKMKAKMWVHNADSPTELLKLWLEYNLMEVSQLIQCPTLVLDSENESLSPGQAEMFFESLSCPKYYHLFTAKDGAGEHCEAGASSLSNQYILDWLQKILVTEQALRDCEKLGSGL